MPKNFDEQTADQRGWNARNAFHKYDGKTFTLKEYADVLKSVIKDNLWHLPSDVTVDDLNGLLWRENWIVEMDGEMLMLDFSRERELTRLEQVEDVYKTLITTWCSTPWKCVQLAETFSDNWLVSADDKFIAELKAFNFPQQEALVKLINEDIPWLIEELKKKQ